MCVLLFYMNIDIWFLCKVALVPLKGDFKFHFQAFLEFEVPARFSKS